MPPGEGNGSAPPGVVGDRIGALSDDILHHLLSFLPVQSAVQTCVLARRWRHLWKSTTGLRIVGVQEQGPVQDLVRFLHHLLVLRERTVLRTVEIKFGEFSGDDESYVNLWTRFAVQWGVRALTLHISHPRQHLELDGLRLVSPHLKTLDLAGVLLEEDSLDFSSCPALEDLKMKFCNIDVEEIHSYSLKHLSIISCESSRYFQTISTPYLISLELDNFIGRTPCLGNMRLLETARVVLGCYCEDCCWNNDDFGVSCGDNDNACSNCVDYNDGGNDGVILDGISNAIHLELMSHYDVLVFTRDLKQCPTFSKLKTLLLNEYWCEGPDLDPLACILKNSPVLEKLTLQLFYTEGDLIEMKGSYSSVERSSVISEHLNIVEVKFHAIDKKVHKVLKFLCALNIRFSFE